MISLTIYRPSTGEILRQFTTDDLDSVLMNIGDDEEAIEGRYMADLWYMSEGDPVAMPESPGDWAVWDWDTHSWDDPRDAAWHATRLAEATTVALAQITRMRGQARLPFITDIPGQEGLYIAKRDEARAYIVDPDPIDNDYPLILSEVGVTAETPWQVAQVFVGLDAMWRVVAGQIDAACFSAEAAVLAATDTASIDLILGALADTLSGATS